MPPVSGEPVIVRKSTPGHGGYRPGAGRKPKADTSLVTQIDDKETRTKEGVKVQQADAYTMIAKAKAKRETFRAHLAELEYKQKTGDLIPADEVASAWGEQIAVAKGRLLAIPSRLAPDVLGMGDLRAIEARIREEIMTVLEELASGPSGN